MEAKVLYSVEMLPNGRVNAKRQTRYYEGDTLITMKNERTCFDVQDVEAARSFLDESHCDAVLRYWEVLNV